MTSTEPTDVIAEPGRHDVVLTRVFDAPRELVYRVFTDPEQVPHWWGPGSLDTVVDEMDVRPGGRWRYVQTDSDGNEYGFHGIYHQVTPPERLVYTFEFEGMPGHVMMETITFEDLGDGRTKLVDVGIFQSIEDRDGMVQSGMESGASASMDRLAVLLAAKV